MKELLILVPRWVFLLMVAAHGSRQHARHLMALMLPTSCPGARARSFSVSLASTVGSVLLASPSL